MKRKMVSVLLSAVMVMALVSGCGSQQTTEEAKSGQTEEAAESTEVSAEEGMQSADGTVYKVGLVQYVDDASLNQIVAAVQSQLDKKGAELGVTFDYADYTYNGQADSSTMNQIATDLIASEVDIIVPIATPTAMVMQNATAENPKEDGSLIPVVFSAVSDPVGAGLTQSMEAPGSNITGTSDALNTEAVFDMMFAANPQMKKVGLLYDKSQDSSTAAIEAAKAYCEAKGAEVVEKTGTTTDELSLATDALLASGVEAVFTPTDNTVMTAELAIYEKFIDAGIPHYCGADSFALNGAFLGYGVNYEDLGTATADLVVEILVNGADPANTAVVTMDNGIASVNTQTAEAIGMDYSMFADMCTNLVEIQTAKEFE